MKPLRMFTAALALAVSSAAFADSFSAGGITTDFEAVKDVKDGTLYVVITGGREQSTEIAKIKKLTFDKIKPFNDAEAIRETKPADAAKLYVSALNSAANAKQKLAMQARAVPILDAGGMYGDAVKNFMDLYVASPTEAAWAMRPVNVPAEAGSRHLIDAATAITSRINTTPFSRDPVATKNLNSMLLEIYNKQGDAAKAAAVAKAMGVDAPAINPTPVANPGTGGTPAIAAPEVVDVNIKAGKVDEVVAQADIKISQAKDDVALISLYKTKAAALAGANRLEEAAATYIRISASFSHRAPDAADALWNAADIQLKLKSAAEAAKKPEEAKAHQEEAMRLGAEIAGRYEKQPAFVKAKAANIIPK